MKTTLLLRPLLAHRPFEHCSSRVAYSMAQQFVNRNGFLFKTTMSAMQDRFRDALPDDEDPAHIASWVESNLESRFDTSHTNRMFRALNTLAEVKASLERVPGFHEEADRIDAVGHAIGYHIAALFRLDDDTKRALESKFPVFAAAWRDALDTDG